LRFRTAETGEDYQHHNAQQPDESKETESHLLTPSRTDRQSRTANRNDKESGEGEWRRCAESPRRISNPILAPIILRSIISIDVSVDGGQSALWKAKVAKGRGFQK
jgi:hypothetical protein